MQLQEFGPDDAAAIAAYVGLGLAADRGDRPWDRPRTAYRQSMEQRFGWDGEISRYFLVREADRVVGILEIFASDYDNLDLAWVELVIAPDRRREGLGTAALQLALEVCAAANRTSIVLYGPESEAARPFATSAGFAEKSFEALRRLDLDGTPEQRDGFARLRDEAAGRAGDYELVRIRTRTPEELLPAIIAVTEAINDAPLDELDYEDEVYDVDRVRRYEKAQQDSGYRFYRLLARHRTTGEIAGHTVVSVDSEQPAWADQHDTAVIPEHRGHRLGLLLKSEMLLWLADVEPGLRFIQTQNAVSNDPMVAVNDRLGMRLVGHQMMFQQRLPVDFG